MAKKIKEEQNMSKLERIEKVAKTDCMTYTIHEVAKLLGINPLAAYNLAKRQDFPAVRIGKRIVVPKAALQRWLER